MTAGAASAQPRAIRMPLMRLPEFRSLSATARANLERLDALRGETCPGDVRALQAWLRGGGTPARAADRTRRFRRSSIAWPMCSAEAPARRKGPGRASARYASWRRAGSRPSTRPIGGWRTSSAGCWPSAAQPAVSGRSAAPRCSACRTPAARSRSFPAPRGPRPAYAAFRAVVQPATGRLRRHGADGGAAQRPSAVRRERAYVTHAVQLGPGATEPGLVVPAALRAELADARKLCPLPQGGAAVRRMRGPGRLPGRRGRTSPGPAQVFARPYGMRPVTPLGRGPLARRARLDEPRPNFRSDFVDGRAMGRLGR